MKKILLASLILSLSVLIIFLSCKKEKSCEGCRDGNKAPIAVAGPDQVITLPTDSVSLDGSASNDPDGTISEWLWTKISGPASFNITNTSNAKTVVKNLSVGNYQLELKVTDNGGLSAKDTIQVTVNSVTPTNRPPVANAGADQTITLPTNTVNLNGSSSTDPDNNITNYLWTKISGPSSFNITNGNAVQTQVTNLVQGVYKFELKVTDAGALFSKDTVQISVNAQPPPECLPTNRPIINVQLIPIGNFPIGNVNNDFGQTIVGADNKIFFAGSHTYYDYSSRIDIYDLTTQNWSTTNLSLPRTYITAVACANKVFFAGGLSNSGVSSRVDIYDMAAQTWATAELSEARCRIVATATGNKVFFAGGSLSVPNGWGSFSNRIDIYDLTTNTWSTASLSEAKIGFTATAADNKIYFAGGWTLNAVVPFANIDIYDDITGTWSTSALNVPKGFHAGIFKNGKIYWAGGQTYIDDPLVGLYVSTCQVEIQDINSQSSTFSNLSNKQHWADGWSDAFEKDDKIGFRNYDQTFYLDIYNTTTNAWSKGIFNQGIGSYNRIISANNNIYLIGEVTVNGVYSTQIWKMEF